jgi:hypothetical protein
MRSNEKDQGLMDLGLTTNDGSIISVVGKTTVGIMEPILL